MQYLKQPDLQRQATEGGDFVTCLQCAREHTATKTHHADGSTLDYDTGTYFLPFEAPVRNIFDLAKVLDSLSRIPSLFVIRGKYAGDDVIDTLAPDAKGKPARGRNGGVLRNLKTFHETGHHWVMLDIDGFMPEVDPDQHPEEAVREFIARQLPVCFHEVTFYWRLSASAGLARNRGILKAHVWFWLDTPYTGPELTVWAQVQARALDRAVFRTVQPHYTADPRFTGMADPITQRGGLCDGWLDSVPLEIPAGLQASARQYEPGADIDMPDPREKPGVIGAFCRALSIEDVLEQDLAAHFEWESPGDPRRLNFLDGSGAPGGAFVSDCREYITNMHASDPFEGRAANKFDLVRHYYFGHLDDPDDPFDDATNSPSYHAMRSHALQLGPVQAELIETQEQERSDRDAELLDPGAEVVQTLEAMDPEQVHSDWLAMAETLGPVAEDAVLNVVSRKTATSRRPLKQALDQHRKELQREKRIEDLRQRGRGRVMISYTPEDVTRLAMEAENLILGQNIGQAWEYCLFGGQLARMVTRRLPRTTGIDAHGEMSAPEVPSISILNRAQLRAKVEEVAVFMRIDPRTNVQLPTEVPAQVLESLMYLDHKTVPQVSGLVTHPITLPTGEILATEGIHDDSELLVHGTEMPDCRAYDHDEAIDAMARIEAHFLDGFHFDTPLDRAAAIAALFTGVQRRVLDAAPGIAIGAASQASGKTTLAQRIHVILTGHDMPVVSFPEHHSDEVAKTIFALLLSAPALVCFDNIRDGLTFRSPTLAQVLSSSTFKQRVLGESREAEVPTNTMFVLTGNNLALGRDELTRWMPVRLAAPDARPDQRRFRYADIVAHGRRVRNQVLRDVVGIVAGYLRHGEPIDPRTRFPAWDRLVRQPLMWAGVQDVGETFARNIAESSDTIAERNLISELFQVFECRPFSARDVVKALADFDTEDATRDRLEDALLALQAKRTDNPRSISWVLRAHAGRRCVVRGTELWLDRGTSEEAVQYRVHCDL